LQAAGLRQRLDAIVGGDEVPRGKPAPDIFLVAASHLGVPAAHCLVLEDSEAGVQAARTAGMTPILVPDLKPPTPAAQKLAHRVVPSLHEVRDYVRELVGHHRGPGEGNEESRDH
jgi:beta-phosphoglucomutase-like phosphatase (HAD superfamily)